MANHAEVPEPKKVEVEAISQAGDPSSNEFPSSAEIDLLTAEVAAQATQHVEDVGWKYLLEPLTAGSYLAMAFGLFSSAFGFAPPASVTLFIQQDLGNRSGTSISLFSVIQTMGMAVGLVVTGRLCDVFGRRYVMMGFTLLGLVGGIVVGTAKNVETFSGAQVFIGLATGAQLCYTFLAAELVPNKHKLFGMALVVSFTVPGTGLGALIARSLVEHATWRYLYYIYLIAEGISLVLYALCYFPVEATQVLSKRRQLMNLDFVGIFFLISGLALFIIGIMTGGAPYPWTSGKVLGMIVSGGVCLVILAVWSAYKGEDAFFAAYLFKDLRGFTMNCICSSIGCITYIALSIVWPTQVARIYGTGLSWQTAGIMSSTVGLGLWIGMVFIAPLWGPIGHPKATLIASEVWTTAFVGALAACGPDNKGYAIAMSFLAALPIGFVELQTGAITQLVVADRDIGTSFGTMGCCRTSVGAIGTAIVLAILNAKIPVELAAHVQPAALAAGLPASSLSDLFAAMAAATPEALAAVPGMTADILAAVSRGELEGYAAAYRYVYYATIPFSLVATAAAVCLSPISHLLDNTVPKMVDRQNAHAVKVEKAVV